MKWRRMIRKDLSLSEFFSSSYGYSAWLVQFQFVCNRTTFSVLVLLPFSISEKFLGPFWYEANIWYHNSLRWLQNIESRFCIIEGPETVQDFAKLDLQEIQDNIRSRRNKIFLHMEEVWFNFFYFTVHVIPIFYVDSKLIFLCWSS